MALQNMTLSNKILSLSISLGGGGDQEQILKKAPQIGDYENGLRSTGLWHVIIRKFLAVE